MNLTCFKASPHSEKGSSSVLVIMVMLMLITFGVLAMMSGYSNYKIAEKNALWTQGYYELESLAEINLNSVVEAVKDARLKTDMDSDEADLLFLNLLTENLLKLNSETFIIEFVDEKEQAPFKVRLTSKLLSEDRYFDAEIWVSGLETSDELFALNVWEERPKAFEYTMEIQYKDPEGEQ